MSKTQSEIIIALLSGQLLLAIWQIVKEMMARRDSRKNYITREQFEKVTEETDLLRQMGLKAYSDNIQARIERNYKRLDEDPLSGNLKEHLRRLQDDMELYTKAGGDGAIHDIYRRFADTVRERLGESYYMLLVVDGMENWG